MPELITSPSIIIPNREAWLNHIANGLIERIEDAAKKKMPAFRVSMGFPSQRALSTKKRRIGECWPGKASTDGRFEIMISPLLDDEVEIGATVGHELVHACVGTEHGHRKPFSDVVYAIGLIGKPTATQAGPRFIELINPIIETVGYKLPHAGLNPMSGGGIHFKKQQTRLLRAKCVHCGYTVRVTQKWLDFGAPICPTHNSVMHVEQK